MLSSQVKKGLLALLLLFSAILPAHSALLVENTQTVAVAREILDVATTADGSVLFALTKGEVQLLGTDGKLIERFPVPADAARIAVAPDGSRLYLAAGQTLRIVELANEVSLPALNSPARGPASAPVTLTVFSDFQCPHCAKLVSFIDEVQAKNPDRVRVVFKQFPLRMHNMAMPAALASLAAREQGKFWPLHDLLFANNSQLSEEKIRSLAQQAGLNMSRFDQDHTAQRLRDEVQRDMNLGQQAGVQGTPAVFVNGKFLRERTLPAVQAMIDRETARARGGR